MKAILSDLSHVLLMPRDTTYRGALNALHRNAVEKLGEDYDAFRYFELNFRLLDFYASLRDRVSVDIFTTDVVQNHRQLRPQLDQACRQIFAAGKLGLSKRDPSAYSFVAARMGVPPVEIAYIDDDASNVEAAARVGMTAFQYVGDDEAIATLSAMLTKA